MTSPSPFDTHGGEKVPAVSFKDVAIGTTIVLRNTKPAGEPVQQTVWNKDPNAPKVKAFWPANADGTPGKPKLAVVIEGTVDGEQQALWCPIPSDIFAKVKDALARAGTNNTGGGDLAVTLVEREPTTGSPKNIFAAEYRKASAFGDAPAQPAQQAAQPATVGPDPAALMEKIRVQIAPWRASGTSDQQIAMMANSIGLRDLAGGQLTAEFVATVLG